jgi:hypothetical protein
MKKIKNLSPISLTYPLWLLLVRNITPMVVFLVIQTLRNGSIISGELIFVLVWFVFFYIIGQFRYARILIYEDRLEKRYLSSLYLKPKVFFFSELQNVLCQTHVGSWVDPYLRFNFKNGKKVKIRMTKMQIMQIRTELMERGIDVLSAKYAYHRP